MTNQTGPELSQIPVYENTSDLISSINDYYSTAENGRSEVEFQSFEDVYQAAIGELESAANTEELLSILETYDHIVYLKDSTIQPLIKDATYRLIMSPDRLYLSDGAIHKVLDDEFLIYSTPDRKEEIAQIESIDDVDEELFTIVNYAQSYSNNDNGRLTSYCPNPSGVTYTKNVSGCSKDRQVTAGIGAAFMVSGGNYTPKIEFTVSGRRRITGCIWINYSTTLEWRNSNANYSYRINGNSYSLNLSGYAGLPSGSMGGSFIVLPVINSSETEYWSGGIPPIIEMTSHHHEASSRGVGSNWAVLDCN